MLFQHNLIHTLGAKHKFHLKLYTELKLQQWQELFKSLIFQNFHVIYLWPTQPKHQSEQWLLHRKSISI